MSYINSTALSEIFSKEKRRGQELLPLLIKKLIISSCNIIGNIRFPSGDAIWNSGFDGIVKDITVSNSFVPLGNSVWELGINEDSLQKINQDYAKRSDDITEYDKNEFSFVLVVPKLWAYKQSILDWEESKRKDHIWKNVIILDAEKIADWISENIEVGNWLLSQVGFKSPINIDTLDTKWKKVTELTVPEFNCELLLNSNKENADLLIKNISATTNNFMVLRSHYGREHALYFTLGALYSCKDSALKEKVIFANNAESLKYIIDNCNNKIVITEYQHNVVLGNKNTYIILLSDSENFIEANVQLNYCTLRNFSRALESIGIDVGESYSLAKKVNNNISILKRRLAKEPLVKRPIWADEKNKDSIIPLLLVTEFSEKEESDKAVIEAITKIPFDEYLISLNQWIGYDDSPVFKYDHIYRINSKEECFSVVNISSAYITRLKELLKTIFSCENEKYNLPADKWDMAGFYGKRSNYNRYIINGIIDSLIILSINSEKIQQECDLLVSEILSTIKNNDNLVLSCSDYFSKLAELSPISFMDFLEEEIDKRSQAILTLVEKISTDSIGYKHSHLNQVCWGLDVCLRIKEYSIQALTIYLKLYLSNFNLPDNFDIIEKVSAYFHPMSSNIIPASIDEKNQLLFDFIEKNSNGNTDTIVKLLKNLLIVVGRSFMVPTGPHWRFHSSEGETEIPFKDLDNCIKGSLNWLLDNTELYSEWLETAFQSMNYMSEQSINNFFEKAILKVKYFNDERKSEVYAVLVKQIYMIKFYEDSEMWMIKNGFINQFYLLLKESTPQEVFLKYRYMFYENLHEFPIKNPIPISCLDDNTVNVFEENYKKAEQEIREALDELVKCYGDEIVSSIAEVISENCGIGNILVDYFDHKKLLKALYSSNKFSILSTCFSTIEPEEVINFIQQYKDKEEQLFPLLPFNNIFVDYVDKKENEEFFWLNRNIYLRGNDEEFFEKAYRKLLVYQPASLINYFIYFEKPFNTKKAKEVLLAVTMNPNGVEKHWHALKQLISKLDSYSYDEEVITCEFGLLPLFKHDDLPLGIKNYFWQNPKHLVELIKNIKNDKFKNTDLKHILIFPFGQCLIPVENIKNKPEEILDWVKSIFAAAETLLEDEKELAIRTILRTISFEKEIQDQPWPSKHISEILELIADKDLLLEFVITKTNARGVRQVGDGSDQYKIMKKYLSYADYYKSKPSTNFVLKKLADSYKFNGDNDKMHSIIEGI